MLHFERIDEAVQKRFLELYLQYAEKDPSDPLHQCIITDALTDGEWYMTIGNYWYDEFFTNVPDQYEFLIAGKNCGGAVRCKILTDTDKSPFYYEITELEEIRGDLLLSEEAVREMLLTYEKMHSKALSWMYPTNAERKSPSQVWRCEDYAAKRKLVLAAPAPWKAIGETLALDYHFRPVTTAERERLAEALRQYRILSDEIKDMQAAEAKVTLEFALTDPQERFLMAKGVAIDQYAYELAVITESSAGVVSVWFDDKTHIRDIRGSIPFPEEELSDMLLYYHRYEDCYGKPALS